ncbi:MAG: excinuclease ABC subunit UvrC [Pararoseburia sp.]|nr:excinuclease ABC subunit UvrC [Pararoseburia sp.]
MKSQFSIEEELAKLPDSPGVYIMHNAKDAIIYVGKAISLRHRVRQYFQPSHDEGIKKAQMVKQIAYFEYIVTDSELEALVLECNLIKEHSPKYNTMLRDDKTYPYIKVTLGEPYPRVLFSRQIKKDKSKYFGPFTSAAAVKDTIDLIQKIYHLRTCTKKFPDSFGRERPCLNYHMKQCLGVCTGNISTEEYQKNVDGAMAFLNGNYQPVIKMLEEKMQDAAGKMEFEKAAEYRNLLGSVNACMQKQKITNANQEGDRDIVALAQSGEDAVVQVFFVRKGKLIGREHFFMNVRLEEVAEEIITDFIQQFYAGTPVIPKEIFLQMELPQQEILERWLSEKKGQKVYLKSPQKGMNNKLVELAEKNAAMVLAQDKERIKKEEGRTIGALKELAGLLHMENLNRMEAFDISNINGFQTVGSMVVFEKGKPLRSDYRKFKLKTITGPDDYGSMREVLTRRFSHGIQEREELKEKGLEEQLGSFTRFPDVIMMDGGRGQVNICLEVLQELGLSIPVCGMVKDDHHRTRGLYVDNVEIPIDKNSEAFHLITRLQDEAHRFAIEYHRSLRSKGQVHSFLDDIEGIGPARRKALMRKYNSAEEMGSATVEELAEIPSMDLRSAQSVYDYFHGLTNRGNTLK